MKVMCYQSAEYHRTLLTMLHIQRKRAKELHELHRVSYLKILMNLMHHYWWLLFIENFRNIGSKTCKQNFLIRNKFQVLKGFHTMRVPVLSSYSCLLLRMRLVWDQQAEFIDSKYGGKTSGHWFGYLTTRLTHTNPKPLQTSIDIPWLRILSSL